MSLKINGILNDNSLETKKWNLVKINKSKKNYVNYQKNNILFIWIIKS